MGIKDIFDLLEKYGLKGGLIAFISVIFYVLYKTGSFKKIFNYLSEKYIEYFMKNKGKSITTDVTISDILNHDIFNYIDFWRFSKVPTFQFSTEYRTVVFKKYLNIYLKIYKENLQNFVNSKSYEDMNDSELWKNFLSLVNDTVHDYEQEMEESGIPIIIINKMKVKNNDVISLMIDLIEGISNSQFYKSENNMLKVYSILNIMLSILENTIHNSEHVCNSINGQLKGLTIQDGGKIYKEP